MQWICYNGSFVPSDQPVFTTSNRSYKYGDALFETATFYQGRILLASYHFERLFSGLKLLHIIADFTPDDLTDLTAELCTKNACATSARVRLTVYRDENNTASFTIEVTPLAQDKMQWNKIGWTLAVYPFARKSCDVFSNVKSANYLPYVLAAQYANDQNVNECLVLNTYNRLCDGSKTNFFFMKGDNVHTPALSEGCIAGIMRRAVIDFLKSSGYAVHQSEVAEAGLLGADQIFVTNAIEGLRWVQRFNEREYGHGVLKKLHDDFMKILYA